MSKKTIRDIDVKDKKVFVRVDYNVPMKDGVIRDDTRIQASVPTVRYLIEHGAKVILASHMGRPDGQKVESLSLKPAAERLSEYIGQKVLMLGDCIGEEVEKAVAEMESSDVVMLENLRFYKQETKNEPEFAKKLASLADIYVDDAFGTAHRAHASTYGVAELLPTRVSGFLMEKELKNLGMIVASPKHPFTAVLGGAKVKDKVAVIKNLLEKVDSLIIGGAMAFSFIKAQGYDVGCSLVDDNLEPAKEILKLAEEKHVKLLLPVDIVAADEVKQGSPYSTVSAFEIPKDKCGVDIGSKTVKLFDECLKSSKTVFWNGPMGVFEIPEFAKGTLSVAESIADSDAISCIGGGDSVAAVKQLGFGDKMTHLSTGGGASLEFVEGKELPGVAILDDTIGRKPVIAGNWKLNKNIAESVALAKEIAERAKGIDYRDIIISPVFTALASVAKELENTNVSLSAQDVYWLEKGAYTGEVAPSMLKDAGCSHTIIGHSERRGYFGETDETVCKKIKAAFAAGLVPIVCIGESLEQKEQGITKQVTAGQIKGAIDGLDAELAERMIIAYEPIWAIGTGKTDTPAGAQDTISSIRAELSAAYGDDSANKIRILYGGSVKPENIDDLMKQPDIDGALVGGASLKADSFERIIKFK